MDDDQSPNEERYTCPECHAGHLSKEYIAYFTWLAGELITVPDFPAWVCDVCGRRDYDAYAIAKLNILLNPSTGRSTRIPRPKFSPPERPSVRP